MKESKPLSGKRVGCSYVSTDYGNWQIIEISSDGTLFLENNDGFCSCGKQYDDGRVDFYDVSIFRERNSGMHCDNLILVPTYNGWVIYEDINITPMEAIEALIDGKNIFFTDKENKINFMDCSIYQNLSIDSDFDIGVKDFIKKSWKRRIYKRGLTSKV